MNKLSELQELITYWKGREESAQRTKVLNYLIKRVQKFIPYSRRNSNGELIKNTAKEVKCASKIIATLFDVPQRKKGEDRYSSMQRLTKVRL